MLESILASKNNIFYTYVYLDPRKPGRYTYENFVTFFYQPFYIGKGKGYRINEHMNNSRNDESFKRKVINKIINNGLKPIGFKLINNIEEKCSLCIEKFLILSIGRRDLDQGPLTNHIDGGNSNTGWKRTEPISMEERRKISERKKGHKDSPQGKLNKSLARRGSKNPAFGKVWINNSKRSILVREDQLESFLNRGWKKGVKDSTKIKTSLQWKNVPKSEDHKRKIGESNKGKCLGHKDSDETIENKRLARLGDKNPAYNSKWMYNDNLKEIRLVKEDEMKFYLNQGWLFGAKYKKKREPLTGNKNPSRISKFKKEIYTYMVAF